MSSEKWGSNQIILVIIRIAIVIAWFGGLLTPLQAAPEPSSTNHVCTKAAIMHEQAMRKQAFKALARLGCGVCLSSRTAQHFVCGAQIR